MCSWKALLETHKNITYQLRKDEQGAFGDSILESKEQYDLIIIDGADRINCARNAVKSLKPSGVIIWDNSDREEYRAGYEFLVLEGFKRIDFFGHGPIGYREWCTSVFYRQNNCFGI